ncbi:uncharacterized protein [Haliotis cracherodii]|uniref:uncharacterized protein n=1 Tax=Haliotis cracherodii TaxID=6455 RepID=UPI0039E9C565
MVLLFLLLTFMYHSRGHALEQEIVYGIGIKLCNLKCIERGACLSFSYNIDRLACHLLHNEAMNSTMKEGYIVHQKQRNQVSTNMCSFVNCKSNTRCVETRHGVAVCVEGHTVTSALESRCITDSDCPAAKMFVCFTKTCKCEPGYSFNPDNNNCVRSCKTYGNGFTTYQGLGIWGYNTKEEFGKTAEECSEMCITEKTFTCVTCEHTLKNGTCLLSRYGYLDAPPSSRDTESQEWTFTVRNCV